MKKNRKYTLLASTLAVALLVSSCGKKEESNNIIIKKKVEQSPRKKATAQMDAFVYTKEVQWVGSTYTIKINRAADKSLPVVADESGSKYYDNRITLTVVRQDGSTFFTRTFSKEDFRSVLGNDYTHDGILLGLMYTETLQDDLKFVASVGSPDPLSDEHIPMIVTLNRMGSVRIAKDRNLEGAEPMNQAPDDEEEGV